MTKREFLLRLFLLFPFILLVFFRPTPSMASDPTGFVVDRVMQWHPLVIRWNTPTHFAGTPNRVYGMDEALVLSVIAKESMGYPQLISCAGAVGLMQVIPGTHVVPEPTHVRPYPGATAWWECPAYYTTRAIGGRPPWQNLLSPPNNVWYGMHILAGAIDNAGGDVRVGLSLYNCGEASYYADKCHPLGGDVYADEVLNTWLPKFEKALEALFPPAPLEYNILHRQSIRII